MECLVVYAFQKEDTHGTGNINYRFEHYPPTMKDIQDAKKELEEYYQMGNICITNWLPLSED